MKQSKFKAIIFWAILFFMVISAIEVMGYIGMWYYSRSFDFASNKNYFRIRDMLIGNKNPEHFPRYLSLPYLGYVPYPGYKKLGIVQNNEDGYRGVKMPLQKSDKLRIICLGGSTTYGFTVDSPSQTFPARLEVLLNARLLNDSVLSNKYHGVEVMNAGLEAGTSAEELQQYLFKYRYYKPDVVIVHSGVNDAMRAAYPPDDFQLDYTDFRRLNFSLEPLSSTGKFFFKSYFISFMAIRLFYDNFAYNGKSGKECFTRQENQLFCKWSHINIDSVVSKKQFDFYPFYRNSKSLFQSVINDSAMLVVFPNALNPKSEFVISNKEYDRKNSLNVSLSQSLASQYGAAYVPFAYDSISDPACWLDDCHVNAKGEKNKAEILARFLMANLRKRLQNQN